MIWVPSGIQESFPLWKLGQRQTREPGRLAHGAERNTKLAIISPQQVETSEGSNSGESNCVLVDPAFTKITTEDRLP